MLICSINLCPECTKDSRAIVAAMCNMAEFTIPMIADGHRILIREKDQFSVLRCEDAHAIIAHIAEEMDAEILFECDNDPGDWHDSASDWIRENGAEHLGELLPGSLKKVHVNEVLLASAWHGEHSHEEAAESDGEEAEESESDDNDDDDYDDDA